MKKTQIKRASMRILVGLMALLMLFSVTASAVGMGVSTNADYIKKLENINTNYESQLDGSVVQKLPDTLKDNDEISVIVTLSYESLMDNYEKTDKEISFAKYCETEEATKIKERVALDKEIFFNKLSKDKVEYEVGATYTNVFTGFEVVIKAGSYGDVCDLLSTGERAYVSEEYLIAETKQVEGEVINTVNVHKTGIFNSSNFKYDGTGMVVAVLDTGLDYTHSAFSPTKFTNTYTLTKEKLAGIVGDSVAAKLTSGLTADDVYINKKVPFGYDYADGDSDVYSLHNNHGTHVSGVIVGNDDTILGVAPNAQLVSMKIFSDVMETARASWILSALEDCVLLGVDVINMSLGTACGFSRESDKELESGVYQKIRDAGISLVVAASNSFNSAYGSEKNGNLGLTSNPDTSTVGSPSTYEGAMSIASINGTKTPYILYEGQIVYFVEATDSANEEKNFFEELLPKGIAEMTMEYVVIPGAGRPADYTGIDIEGKIALVRRGSTTFEEKANAAQMKGAAGIIIYNNTSGEIKMNAGITSIPICSISQDDGEMLAAKDKGIIKISTEQSAGPFMSDFSSWGPSPDLEIKPEITAHGGNILSAVTGGDYDRLSGTSMACPNMAGVIALLRQYVIDEFPDRIKREDGTVDGKKVNALVNRLLMSTADVVYNKNGLPYAVRKQGAGLASLDDAAATNALILTYNRYNGQVMDKSKIELGDDPTKSGVYKLKFAIDNFGSSAISYDINAIVMTEGVSETPTHQGETVVTEEGYELSGAKVEITSCTGTYNGMNVTVAAGSVCEITVTVTLSDADKEYLNKSFENGMYVEGFITLDATNKEEQDLSVPYLAFYGDWYEAPLFDLDYFETNKDELDDSIELLDKTLPDAYASRPIGGVSDDYVSYLGSYYFLQNPKNKIVSAKREYIAISNTEGSIHSLRFVWAGLLRNAKKIVVTITDDATGEVIFETVEENVRKSYGDGGSYIYPANVDIEFDAMEQNLKNNTTYTVKLQGYLDYGNGGIEANENSTFEFPLTTDFQAPAVTDVEFYTEYDRSEKKTRLFAKMAVYDNHYAMAMQIGYVGDGVDEKGEPTPTLYPFESYTTPVYSTHNGTTYVSYELTDYIYDIKNNSYNPNTFTVSLYDYALNEATYEIPLPDEFKDFYFEEEDITLSPNEIYSLKPLIYPDTEWGELLCYTSSNEKVVRVVNDKLVAVGSGEAAVFVYDPKNPDKEIILSIKVLTENDEGYRKIAKTPVDVFKLTGYKTLKAYFLLNNDDRELGVTGDDVVFTGNSYSLKFYPSESIQLKYKLDSFYPDETSLKFVTGDDEVVTVTDEGVITAVAEGYTTVTANVLLDGNGTYYTETISIEVVDPYLRTGPSLTNYYGLGGVVDIPANMLFTEIGQFAFSNYDYVPKDFEMGDVIDEDEVDTTKIWYIGDDTITKVIIPEGVKKIGPYAFAGLTALTEVVLPSTLEAIEYGAFYGCSSLKTVKGLEYPKLINTNAFAGTSLTGELKLDNARAVSDYAFANVNIRYYDYEKEVWATRTDSNPTFTKVTFSEHIGSFGEYAFAGNHRLKSFSVGAEKVKYGPYVFMGCTGLEEAYVNANVIPMGAFLGCSSLKSITLGKDVAGFGEYAFMKTALESFTVEEGNTSFLANDKKPYLLSADGSTLVLVAPKASGEFTVTESGVTVIDRGAFSGNSSITSVNIPTVDTVRGYAFADCGRLTGVTLGKLKTVEEYAFYNTPITILPEFDDSLSLIGDYAFAFTDVTEVNIKNNLDEGILVIGEGAFCECQKLESVVIGDDIEIGFGAFMLGLNTENERTKENNWKTSTFTVDGKVYYGYELLSALTKLEIGERVTVGEAAFMGASKLIGVTLKGEIKLGAKAFYNAPSLQNIDLTKVTEIGDMAFSGDVIYLYKDNNFNNVATKDGYYVYKYYTPVFTTVDLSNVEKLGKQAFQYCKTLKNVVLGEKLTEVPYMAFANCDLLESVNLGYVKTLGYAAFSETNLKSALDLSSVEVIGEYAFTYCDELTSVKFNPEGAKIEEGAFSYASKLASCENLSKVTEIGNYAFAYTALTELDLSGAISVGDFAFIKELSDGGDRTHVTVKLGEGLELLGDNPFAMCEVDAFYTTEDVYFGEVLQETKTLYTYDISDSVKVIDGSLYCKVPYGYELITYTGSQDANLIIPEDTVRISAMALAGSGVEKVTLPHSLNSIGHKAFYACPELKLVAFKSYRAPILEEEFDQNYHDSFENIPCIGDFEFTTGEDKDGDGMTDIVVHQGLGIVPFYMWNVASGKYSSIYYGANFVDYIGHYDEYSNMGDLLMIRPSNGTYYDTFIYSQYFSAVIDGTAAADDVTMEAIEAINRLPEQVRLSDEQLVIDARSKYNKITSLEQQALVSSVYSKLKDAEIRIQKLKENASEPDIEPEVPVVPELPKDEVDAGKVVLTVLVIVETVAILGFVGLILYKKYFKEMIEMKRLAKEEATTEEAAAEETAEEATEEEAADDASGEKEENTDNE